MNAFLKPRIGKVLRGVAIFAAGYFVAIWCCRQSIWIEQSTGRVETRVAIFPFTIRQGHTDRAFEVYFKSRSNKISASKWMLVNSSGFVPSSRYDYTVGEMLLSAERYLVQADLENGFTPQQRKKIAQTFLEHLENGGVAEAHRFSLSLLSGEVDICKEPANE